MRYNIENIVIEIPTLLIDKFADDFKDLAGSKNRESVYMLRDAIDDVMDLVYEDPEMLQDPVYKKDYIRAVAMREALKKHGIYYDA
jgi:hypothetical protein